MVTTGTYSHIFKGMRCTLHPSISPCRPPSRFARSQYVLKAQPHAFCAREQVLETIRQPVTNCLRFEHSIVLLS